jgi:replicative DNA helicase
MNTLTSGVVGVLMTEQGWSEYQSLLSDDLFPEGISRSLYGYVKQLHEAGSRDITPVQLGQYILAMNPLTPERAEEIIDAIPKDQTVDDHTARAFISRQLLSQASQYTASNLFSPGLDPAVVLDYATRAMEVRYQGAKDVLDFGLLPLPGSADDRPGVVGLGVSAELDSCLGGGVAAGELAVLLAPPNRGKTSVLCAIGAMASAAGKRPLHVTLEISGTRVARRYECAWTRATLPELVQSPEVAERARARIAALGTWPVIRDWSYTEATPHDVHALVKRLRRQGQAPDLVILDYLELMVPNRSKYIARSEQRHIWGRLGRDTRSMAVELGVPVLTAWQVNREGSEVDRIQLQHVSECWDIIKHADAIIALDQTPPEAQHNVMLFSILKQRDSSIRRSIRTHCNLDRCEIRDPNTVGGVHVAVPTAAVDPAFDRPPAAGSPAI